MCRSLPVPTSVETELGLAAVKCNGLNAAFDAVISCIVAEPHASILRIGVTDGKFEVAYELAVLGRLRRGYRIFRLR
eukprot:4148040-Prymnesium_polylepis.1